MGLDRVGSQIEGDRLAERKRWAETKEDIGFNYEPEYKWVLVVAKK